MKHQLHPKLHRFMLKLRRIWRWTMHHKKRILLIILALIAAWFIFAVSVAMWYQHKHRHDRFEPGVSFSEKYAKELGVDWQANYTALLDDAGFKYVRLMSYWDDTEPQPGQYSFGDLDWQMDQAAKRGVKVTLTLGRRQPRWPECHQPQWVDQLSQANQDIELMKFLHAVVDRYKNNPALESYQLENEIANRLFAPQCHTFERAVLWQEYNTVKQLDSKHPLVINVSNQSGIPVRGPIGDKVGFSIYNIAFARFGPFGYYWSFGWVPAWWHSYRAGLIELFEHKSTFIHELQAEPWGPAATKDLSLEEQNRSMSPDRIRQQVAYGKKIGMERMYLWGGEWWYWRKTQFNDPSLWDTVKQVTAEQQKGSR
ncbi:MAG TPA: beta-galactosidase [Candidatus Saccharimonadales bacterium]|nr:beta-galactosidase [Candidatus Saccharimonadales bacterium]